MDVNLINPFVDALIEITESMAQISGQIGKPRLKKGNKAQGVVSGFIRMANANINGSLSISFSEPVLLGIYEKMLGESLDEIDDSCYDLVGELTNMVCGGAKRRLSEQNLDFDLATPIVLKGADHEIMHLDNYPVILLPFNYEMGEIYIEVCLSR